MKAPGPGSGGNRSGQLSASEQQGGSAHAAGGREERDHSVPASGLAKRQRGVTKRWTMKSRASNPQSRVRAKRLRCSRSFGKELPHLLTGRKNTQTGDFKRWRLKVSRRSLPSARLRGEICGFFLCAKLELLSELAVRELCMRCRINVPAHCLRRPRKSGIGSI